MFLTKTVADEIRAMFPGASNEWLRLEIRRCIREGLNLMDLAQSPFFSTAGVEKLRQISLVLQRQAA